MKAQRKDVDTAKTHVAVRLKKGGANRSAMRFEVLIKRESYKPVAQRGKDFKWTDLPTGDIVQEVFANSAKLETADKSDLDACFPDKTKAEIIAEILDRGELQVSDVDRSEHTVSATEYYTKVATLIASRALGVPKAEEQDDAAAAAAGGAAAAAAAAKKNKKKTHSDSSDAPASRVIHYDAAIIERELKNVKWKPIQPAKGQPAVDIEDDVNSGFLALAKKSDLEGLLRDSRVWNIDTKKAADAQEFLAALAATAKQRPYKVLRCVTDKSGGQQLSILVDAEITQVKFDAAAKDGFDMVRVTKPHMPASQEENLAFFVPTAPAATAKVASQPAAAAASSSAAAAAAAAASSGDKKNSGGKKVADPFDDEDDHVPAGGSKQPGGKKAGGKKAPQEAAAPASAPAPKKGGGAAATKVKGGGDLADELAKLGKKNDDDSSSDDDKPKMQVKRKK